jgi:hypothetical protein
LWRGNVPAGSGSLRSAPAIANGVVYIGDSSLAAFDAAGVTNCSGTPKTCLPLWYTPGLNAEFNGAAVAHGVVYGSYFGGYLYTFDAAGNSGCSGIPKGCTPLWSARLNFPAASSVSIAGDVAYVTGQNTLYAFDAAGARKCFGSPKICSPLWVGSGVSFYSPTITGGVVYASDGTKVRAYTLP